MKTYIALFRGINVGGNNKLPMKELAVVLEGLGLQGVATYIQSGNVVFQGKAVDPALLSKKSALPSAKATASNPGCGCSICRRWNR